MNVISINLMNPIWNSRPKKSYIRFFARCSIIQCKTFSSVQYGIESSQPRRRRAHPQKEIKRKWSWNDETAATGFHSRLSVKWRSTVKECEREANIGRKRSRERDALLSLATSASLHFNESEFRPVHVMGVNGWKNFRRCIAFDTHRLRSVQVNSSERRMYVCIICTRW